MSNGIVAIRCVDPQENNVKREVVVVVNYTEFHVAAFDVISMMMNASVIVCLLHISYGRNMIKLLDPPKEFCTSMNKE